MEPLTIPSLIGVQLSREQVEKIAQAVLDLQQQEAADAARKSAKVVPLRRQRTE